MTKKHFKHGFKLFTSWMATILGFNCMVFGALGALAGANPWECLGLGLFGFFEFAYARQWQIQLEEEAAKDLKK